MIKKQIEENSIIENQYIQDEKLFLNEKTNIKSGLAKNYCSLPEEVINGDWEIISSYFKNYFRKSSDKVFPIIGWEYAFGHALILSSYYNNWKEINDAIIVYGESVELASVMALFLCRYIKYVENHSNPLHYFVKALVLFIQILRLKDAEDIFSLMRTCQGEKISEMAILVSYPTFRFKVLELFEALREAKDIAIKQNDEKILNFIITEENKYNNIFGWVKKYPQNNS